MPGCGIHSGPKLAFVARNPDKLTQNKLKTNKKTYVQFFDKTSTFDFSNIFRAMRICGMNTKSRLMLNLPKSMVTYLEIGKQTLEN